MQSGFAVGFGGVGGAADGTALAIGGGRHAPGAPRGLCGADAALAIGNDPTATVVPASVAIGVALAVVAGATLADGIAATDADAAAAARAASFESIDDFTTKPPTASITTSPTAPPTIAIVRPLFRGGSGATSSPRSLDTGDAVVPPARFRGGM